MKEIVNKDSSVMSISELSDNYTGTPYGLISKSGDKAFIQTREFEKSPCEVVARRNFHKKNRFGRFTSDTEKEVIEKALAEGWRVFQFNDSKELLAWLNED